MVGNNFRLNIQLWELSSCLIQRTKSLKPRLFLSSSWQFVLSPTLISCIRELAEIFFTIYFFFFPLHNSFVKVINYILFYFFPVFEVYHWHNPCIFWNYLEV